MTAQIKNKISIEVDPEFNGTRLDLFLTELLEKFSRSRIQKLISDNAVLVNDKPSKNSYKLRYGDVLEISIPEDKPLEVLPEDIPLEFVYNDEYLAVINKPPGMLTHPAPGKYTGTLVNALLYHCKDSLSGINGVLRPGIVHRLDKDTSGLIIIAKNDEAHKHLAAQIQGRTIEKYYIALVQGNIKEETGVINAPIDRHPINREKMTVVEGGREALTTWKVLERFGQATFIEARLHTGRTHQLRVHFSHIKHPILGDPLYSNIKTQKIKLHRQSLQACKLVFVHPKTGKSINLEIDIDPDIKKVLTIFDSQYLQERTPI